MKESSEKRQGNKWFTQWMRSLLGKPNDPLSHSWSKIKRSKGRKSFQWLSLSFSIELRWVMKPEVLYSPLILTRIFTSSISFIHSCSHFNTSAPQIESRTQTGRQPKKEILSESLLRLQHQLQVRRDSVIYSTSLQRRGNRGIRSLITEIDKTFSGSLSRK